ncbi:MAG: alpha/beta hydrolase-fold protein [Clostridiaceae bacterium]|nr:alpha/beta hydrolase-fold protein [Clostridiaceae bacterium]
MPNFDFMDNRVFDDRFSAFAPQGPQTIRDPETKETRQINTGVHVRDNGDAEFSIYAPNALQVSVIFGIRANEPLAMTKGEDGVWRAVLPYDASFCGPKAFTFDIDGASVISQFCPQYYSHGMTVNYVEIPDPNEDFILMRDVPHGSVNTHFYWSDALNTWHRCLVYTPPMYHEGGVYPVLYLQHGSGENETSWVYCGRASHIMDNLIADGKAVPCVIVMNDGMVRTGNEGPHNYGSAFFSTVIDNCIPFIESHYRVYRDKWHRAVAGFSMGSMQASVMGLTNLDKFAYIGVLSGFMRRVGKGFSMSPMEENEHLRFMLDRENFLKECRLYYRSIGTNDYYLKWFEQDNEMLAETGMDQYPNVESHTIPGYPHDWSTLRIELRDFLVRIFRD